MKLHVLLLIIFGLNASKLEASIADEEDSKPCSFPKACSCELTDVVTFLRCRSMENCINQNGMDAIASSIHEDTCPVSRFSVSCSPGSVWPIFEITSNLFRHKQWRRLKQLLFGSGCSFVFRELQVLSNLPNLKDLVLQDTSVSMDLGRFSDIFCCPRSLSVLLLHNVGAEVGGTRFGHSSFLGFNRLSKLSIVNSPKLMNIMNLLLNTSSPSFSFHWCGNLWPVNSNFSSLSIANLANVSALDLELSTSNANFNLDYPARIVGFTLTRLVMSNVRLVRIGDSPFRGFSLKDLSVTGSGLNQSLLSKLLSTLKQCDDCRQLKKLGLQFRLRKPAFLFEDFNSLCASLPILRQLVISHSSISFADPDPERHFECPQLHLLSITNSNLRDVDLPPQVFKRLTHLTSLRLMSNKLEIFPKELLRFTSKLKYLDLSGNFWMELRASSLHGILPGLVTLRMTQTSFSESLTEAFISQPNLTKLYLNYMRFVGHTECPFGKTWFLNCSKLRTLSLERNDVFGRARCQAEGFFDPLVGLKELNLDKCNFGHQSEGIVKSLLTKLASLETLVLSWNNIGRLEHIMSQRMQNLTVLDVSSNPFSSIPRKLFSTRTPELKLLYLMRTPIANIDPETFSHMTDLRIKLGRNQFACNCDLLPFTNWLRHQWPIYQMEAREDWLLDAVCYTTSNRTIRLLDFRMSWWDCYSRRLIVLLASSIVTLLLIFGFISFLVKYHCKLQYCLLAFCIRHQLVRRKIPSEWIYDGCFIYDETDERVSQWVEHLIHKLETDLQLRLYEPQRDAPAGANILDEAASAIDKSRHAVLVLTRGFLENRLNLYSAQWSNESLFLRRRSLAVMVMRESLSESELRIPGCKVLHRLYRMCKPDWIIDCSGCGIGSNSANRLGLMLYKGARIPDEKPQECDTSEIEPLLPEH